MAKFRCKHSGTVVVFENAYDIKTTRNNPEYEEIVENIVVAPAVILKEATKPRNTTNRQKVIKEE